MVSGIGFLGAGAILRDGANVKGINTAATLWSSAAVGALCGADLLIEAVTLRFVEVIATLTATAVDPRELDRLSDDFSKRPHIAHATWSQRVMD